MTEETSESGSPIYRHSEPTDRQWTPPDMSGSSIEAISKHIEEHVGKIATVYHEIVSDLVHVDVHVVAPAPLRPYYTLVTSGMSDLPMTVPEAAHDWRHAEVMISLPARWPMKQADFDDEANFWPVRCLKVLARFPHEYRTWLSWGHTVPNGDPPKAFAATTRMSSVMLGTPATLSTEFHALRVSATKTIHFFSVLPLYDDELEFKLKHGAAALMERFERTKTSELLDPARRTVLRRPWWRMM